MKKDKTKDEILSQIYVTAKDIKLLIPTLGINKCQTYIHDAQEEMTEKGLFVPRTKPHLALTKIVKKRLGI